MQEVRKWLKNKHNGYRKVDASMLVHEYEEVKAINSFEDKERVASTLEEWLKHAYPQASDYVNKLKKKETIFP